MLKGKAPNVQISNFEPQVVIIGSGPAGVSAAFPLVERGVRVLMLNAGREATDHSILNRHNTLRQVRESSKHWKLMVGERFERFDLDYGTSPKYRLPSYRHDFAEFKQYNMIRTGDFTAHGSLACGGLSNLWGANVDRFDDSDLEDFPISLEDIRRSYQRVSRRIGLSGTNNDDLSSFHGYEESLQPPLIMSRNARLLYSRYLSRPGPAHRHGVLLGHPRRAVLTRNYQDRQGCINCGLCGYGCASQSIWLAKYDLTKLLQFPNFSYRDGAFVSYLHRLGANYVMGIGPDRHRTTEKIQTNRVVLACGAIGSARLVMDALGLYDKSRRLLTHLMAVFAVTVPHWRMGSLEDEDATNLAQLAFSVKKPGSNERNAYGYFFLADTIPMADFLPYVPFPYPLSRQIARSLQPILLLGSSFFDGSYSCNTMRLRPSGELEIHGDITPTAESAMRSTLTQLAGALLPYGAYLLPGSKNLCNVGDDAHYAGTVPMRVSPRIGEANSHGEVRGLPGVYVVDGSALTALPAKAHTLTIMANADRIATAIATA